MKRFAAIIFTTVMLLGLFSCENNKVYNDYHQIPNYDWKIDNTLKFNIIITDTITPCDIYFNIRNSGKYPYQNLWLFIKETNPENHSNSEKFNCELANKTGRWKGSGFGDIFDLKIPYKKNVTFKQSGIYTFEITHGMRDTLLKGIVNVGIQIDKVEK